MRLCGGQEGLTRLIHLATEHGCASISIENLGFDEARDTGRETMGRGRQHWLPALQTSDQTIDGHRAAAVVIGRRSRGGLPAKPGKLTVI